MSEKICKFCNGFGSGSPSFSPDDPPLCIDCDGSGFERGWSGRALAVEKENALMKKQRDNAEDGQQKAMERANELARENAALTAKLETVRGWHVDAYDRIIELEAKLAMVEKARDSWWLNHRNDWDFNWILKTVLTTEPKVLAVVDGLVHKGKFSATKFMEDNRIAVWRSSDCEHPDYDKVTVIVLAREG